MAEHRRTREPFERRDGPTQMAKLSGRLRSGAVWLALASALIACTGSPSAPKPSGARPSSDVAVTPSLVSPTGQEYLAGDIDTFSGVWELLGSDDGTTRCQRIRRVGLPEPRLCVDASTPLPDIHLTQIRSREMAFGAAPPGTASVEVLAEGAAEPFVGAVLPAPPRMRVGYPLYAVPLGGSGPGMITFLDEADSPLTEFSLMWKDRGQRAQPKIEGVFPVGKIFARGEDPVAGPWWIYGIDEPYGQVIRVRGSDAVAGLVVKPPGDQVLGQTMIAGFGKDALLVVQPVSPAVDRVEMRMTDGSTITGRLHPVPRSLLEGTSLFVAAFRGQITAEGTEISPGGEIVAFDASGARAEEEASRGCRRSLISHRHDQWRGSGLHAALRPDGPREAGVGCGRSPVSRCWPVPSQGHCFKQPSRCFLVDHAAHPGCGLNALAFTLWPAPSSAAHCPCRWQSSFLRGAAGADDHVGAPSCKESRRPVGVGSQQRVETGDDGQRAGDGRSDSDQWRRLRRVLHPRTRSAVQSAGACDAGRLGGGGDHTGCLPPRMGEMDTRFSHGCTNGVSAPCGVQCLPEPSP